MAEIVRNRVIRPSSRQKSSTNYKIDTEKVSFNDTLVVNLSHEIIPFSKTFKFGGGEIYPKKSIHFKVIENDGRVDVIWTAMNESIGTQKTSSIIQKGAVGQTQPPPIGQKLSLPPISDEKTEILILGTLPGDESLRLGEYYANPRNRFWNVIAHLTNSPRPNTWQEKKQILLSNRVGIWDVAFSAERNKSADSNIKNEAPNNLVSFISSHKKLRTIVFNGAKAQILFDKYFDRKSNLKYIMLPSTSPANTSFNAEMWHEIWKVLKS